MQLHKTNKTVLSINNYESILTGVSTNTKEAYENAFVERNGKLIARFYQSFTQDKWLLITENQYEEVN